MNLAKIPCYIISMDQRRFGRTWRNLKDAGVQGVHAPGVDGKSSRWRDPTLSLFGNLVAPDHAIGCGLAHVRLAKHILAEDHALALVVEDDVHVLSPHTLEADIREAVAKAAPRWEMLQLHCAGLCRDRLPLRTSTAAYLLTREGARKLASMRLHNHIDYTTDSAYIDKRVGPHLFGTYDDARWSSGKLSFGMVANTGLIRVGDSTLTVGAGLVATTISAVILYFLPTRPDIRINLAIGWFSLLGIALYYCSAESNHYRSAPVTHYFGLVMPLIMLSLQGYTKNSLVRYTIVTLAYMLLWFHVLHHLGSL